MRLVPSLGAVNLALLAIYFGPVWGREALRALVSPYSGLEDRAHAAVAIYFRQLFDLGLDGMMRVSNVLAGLKLVIAAGFVAYLIEFVRAIVIGREPNRETADAVLALAVAAILIWALPVLMIDDPVLVRVCATQLMLVAGAVVVVTVDRQIERAASVKPPMLAPVVRERSLEQRTLATGGLLTAASERRLLLRDQGATHQRESAPSL
jgi:hypothetical protein